MGLFKQYTSKSEKLLPLLCITESLIHMYMYTVHMKSAIILIILKIATLDLGKHRLSVYLT